MYVNMYVHMSMEQLSHTHIQLFARARPRAGTHTLPVYMYIRIHVYMYIRICIHVYMNTCIYDSCLTRTYDYFFARVQQLRHKPLLCICMYEFMYTYIHECVHTYKKQPSQRTFDCSHASVQQLKRTPFLCSICLYVRMYLCI